MSEDFRNIPLSKEQLKRVQFLMFSPNSCFNEKEEFNEYIVPIAFNLEYTKFKVLYFNEVNLYQFALDLELDPNDPCHEQRYLYVLNQDLKNKGIAIGEEGGPFEYIKKNLNLLEVPRLKRDLKKERYVISHIFDVEEFEEEVEKKLNAIRRDRPRLCDCYFNKKDLRISNGGGVTINNIIDLGKFGQQIFNDKYKYDNFSQEDEEELNDYMKF